MPNHAGVEAFSVAVVEADAQTRPFPDRSSQTSPRLLDQQQPSTCCLFQHVPRPQSAIIDLFKSHIDHGSSFGYTIDVITRDCICKDLQSILHICVYSRHVLDAYAKPHITHAYQESHVVACMLFAPYQPRDPRNPHNCLAVRHEGGAADPHTSARTSSGNFMLVFRMLEKCHLKKMSN